MRMTRWVSSAALKLRQPIYRQLAAYGHIGREDLGVEWEKTNKVDELKKPQAFAKGRL